jgi:L-lactate dehydrogenase (cytochrome)
VTRAELAQHSSRNSAWVAVNGDVFDVTNFVLRHPGGSAVILGHAGRDASDVFNSSHAPHVRANERMGNLLIGHLAD